MHLSAVVMLTNAKHMVMRWTLPNHACIGQTIQRFHASSSTVHHFQGMPSSTFIQLLLHMLFNLQKCLQQTMHPPPDRTLG